MRQAAGGQNQNLVPLLTATCPSKPPSEEEAKKQQVAELMKEYIELYKEGKYSEAAAVPRKAHGLDPDNAVPVAAIEIAGMAVAFPVRNGAVNPVFYAGVGF